MYLSKQIVPISFNQSNQYCTLDSFIASNIDRRDFLYTPVAIDNTLQKFNKLYLSLFSELILSVGSFQNISNANPTTIVLKPYLSYTVDTYTPLAGEANYSGEWKFVDVEAGGSAYEKVCVIPASNTSSIFTYQLTEFSLINRQVIDDLGAITLDDASLLLRFPGHFTFKMIYDLVDGRNVLPSPLTFTDIFALENWNKLTLGILPAYIT